jgi:mono/diheme cytochrome c family protein
MIKKVLVVAGLCIGAGWIALAQNAPLAQSIQRGKEVFSSTCKNCHMENGQGIPNMYPPLAQSDYLAKDTKRAISIVLNGINGEITVNGKIYNLDMPAQTQLTDQQVTDVLNYVRNTWGNKSKAISISQVKAERTTK